jgi:hypothetical protein
MTDALLDQNPPEHCVERLIPPMVVHHVDPVTLG